jgi:ABC-type multidrug transport system fused ATPase/permease subunit
LILDEATSALDARTERRVLEDLMADRGRRTLILIAHRLGNLTGVDAVCVIDRGRVVESGTHAELHRMGGLYRTLWDDHQRAEDEPQRA